MVAQTSTELAEQRTELALDRTVMAGERTLMAWSRTGLSQIGLGLSLFKFLEAIKAHRGYVLALIVIMLGTVGTVFGIIDYVATIKRLNRNHTAHLPALHYQFVMATLIAVFGVCIFVMLLTGWLK